MAANGGEPLLCVDTGTTNTRLWRLEGDRVVGRLEAPAGARDTAREGHNARLKQILRGLVTEALRWEPGRPRPERIAAAGMITSAQGLLEIPHVPAPAGVAELRAALREVTLPDVAELPFCFVPGVRTTRRPGAQEGVPASDVMRGEETSCAGLQVLGLLVPGEALLNVGSHWKLIRLDEQGRIAWSVTSLSGELVQALRAQTVLASALPERALAHADVDQVRAGMREARRSGLPRALFCVRLLEQAGGSTPEQRLSFLVGALIAGDLDAWRESGCLAPGTHVRISGGDKLGGAWSLALAEAGCAAEELTPTAVEAGFLAGLRALCGSPSLLRRGSLV